MFGISQEESTTSTPVQPKNLSSSGLFGTSPKLFGSQKQPTSAPKSLFGSTPSEGNVGNFFGSATNQPQLSVSLFGKPNNALNVPKPSTGGFTVALPSQSNATQTRSEELLAATKPSIEASSSQQAPNVSSLTENEKNASFLPEIPSREVIQGSTQQQNSLFSGIGTKNPEAFSVDPDPNKLSSSFLSQPKKSTISTVQPTDDNTYASLPSVPNVFKDNTDTAKTQSSNLFNIQKTTQFGTNTKSPITAEALETQDEDKSKKPTKEPSLLTQAKLSPRLPVFGSNSDGKETLESNYYERVDDLLKSWQQRTNRQVTGFTRFTEAIVSLDLDLCECVSQVEKLRITQTAIETKQQEIDSSLDQIEKHQTTLFEKLQKLQSVFSNQPLSTVSIHKEISSSDKFQTKLQSFASSLDDSEVVIETLITDLNKIQEVLYPGPIGEVIELLNIQQRSISKLYCESRSLREKLYQLEH